MKDDLKVRMKHGELTISSEWTTERKAEKNGPHLHGVELLILQSLIRAPGPHGYRLTEGQIRGPCAQAHPEELKAVAKSEARVIGIDRSNSRREGEGAM